MACDPGTGTWEFNNKMTYTKGIGWQCEFSYPKDATKNAYFTFFDIEGLTKWPENNNNRYGDKTTEFSPMSGFKYSIAKAKDNCYYISKDQKGRYLITLDYDSTDPDNLEKSFIKFDLLESYGSEEPEIPEINASNYIFFEKPDTWTRPMVWAWISQGSSNISCNHNTKWPGDEMELYSGKTYIWKAPEGKVPTMFLISDNGTGTRAGSGDGDQPFYNKATYLADGTHTGGESPVLPSESAGKVTEWKRVDNIVTVTCENTTLFITPYSKNVVKVFTLPKGSSAQERRSISVMASPDAEFDCSETDEAVMISISRGAQVRINKSTGLISFLNAEGELKLEENKYLNNHTHTVSFKPMNDTGFFGGGYNGKWNSIKDRTLRLDNTQTGGWGQNKYEYPHNICVPFVISTSGYGVLFDDHYRGAIMSPSSSGLSYSSGSLNPISYYYIGGESLDEVVANYTSLTGRQELPPYWALGYLTSRFGYYSFAEGDSFIKRIKEADIPLDGIIYDIYWEGDQLSGMGNLDWYKPNFPDPAAQLNKWKKDGIHTTLITEPYFTACTDNYNIMIEKGYHADADNPNMSWLGGSKVGLLDATNPEALDWMWSFYKARTEEGVDGWWLDLGEPESHGPNARHKGGSIEQIHNEFGQLWLERVYRGMKEDFPQKRPFIMPRCGTSGMQRLSAFPWTGDILRSWDGLAAQIPALVNSSMSGISYLNGDTGGFTATSTNPELYLRWIEFAVFSPQMRTHGQYKPEPVNDEYSRVLSDVRKFINLRYRFLPYNYTLSYLNSSAGLPMARPACAFDSDPSRLIDCRDAYLWGKDIFVAPVISNTNSRSITFPDGEWVDFNDMSKVYAGGSKVQYNADLSILPYFMRRGSFIPVFTQTEKFGSTSKVDYSDITIFHNVDLSKTGNYEGMMYEDDRTSPTSLADDAYALLHFKGTASGAGDYTISCYPDINDRNEFLPQTRTIRLRFRGYDGDLSRIRLDISGSQPSGFLAPAPRESASLELKNSPEEVDSHTGNAFHRSADGEIYLKMSVPATSGAELSFGNINTGIESSFASEAIRIEYCNGMINYTVPAGYDSAIIEYVTADGRIIGIENSIAADGLIHSLEAPAAGFCIARIKAANTSSTITRQIKFIN